ncbi:MAG: hypothetical protein ACLVCH_02680 [Roseburia inulinivorans]
MKKSVDYYTGVHAVSLPGSSAIRKFWLMSQPQKKSMVKSMPVFQLQVTRRRFADAVAMARKKHH